jgi:hypothetical protein
MNKILAWTWVVLAVVNLVTYIIDGFADFDNVHIAMLQGLLAMYNFEKAKRGA